MFKLRLGLGLKLRLCLGKSGRDGWFWD